jgi:hypothetical protein
VGDFDFDVCGQTCLGCFFFPLLLVVASSAVVFLVRAISFVRIRDPFQSTPPSLSLEPPNDRLDVVNTPPPGPPADRL